MYDEFESTNEANATAQVDYDKLCLLYAIGCESDTAGNNMPTLCSMAGVDYEALKQFAPLTF